MNWKIRQFHRLMAITFTAVVVGIFVALGIGEKPVQWIYYLPLPPLALLMLTGLYLFALPYFEKGQGSDG